MPISLTEHREHEALAERAFALWSELRNCAKTADTMKIGSRRVYHWKVRFEWENALRKFRFRWMKMAGEECPI